jgi:DNA polymerase beta
MNLTKIYGIGPKMAMKLHEEHGITTINELKEVVYGSADKILNDKQLIGLSYFDDLQERIPRAEITEFETIVKEMAFKISPDIKLSINGSYRRGLATSGDIDVLLTSPKGTTEKYRKQLIINLEKVGIIKETLASGKKKFMGIAFLSGKKARHIDIIETDPDNFPFAVLYFTGSGGFNTWMRGYALSLGYSINEYTISHKDTMVPISPEEISKKIGKVRFEEESDIFKFLGLEYVPPTERNDTTVGKTF